MKSSYQKIRHQKFIMKMVSQSVKLFMILWVFCPFVLNAQDETVTGTITDADYVPLSGVTVVYDLQGDSVVTGENGTFSIPGVSGVISLAVTKEGYVSEVFDWNTGNPLTVVLTRKSDMANEIQVGMQYPSESRLHRNDYNNLFSDDPLTALQGKTSGVNVRSTSGEPGGMSLLEIRGLNSMFFNQEPLILQDGIPILQTTDLIANDVKSIRVIKDEASLAEYGSRGANGVILIETKKGQLGENSAVFNSSFGMSEVPKTLDMLNGQQAFQLMQDLNEPLLGTAEDKSIYWGPGQFQSGAFINTNDLRNINWQDELFQQGLRQAYNLAFTGGSENTRFRVAGSYLDNQGIVRPSDYQRMNIAFNVEHKANEKLTIAAGLNYLNAKSKPVNTDSSAVGGNVILQGLAAAPFLPVYDSTGEFFINPLNPQINNVNANIHGYYHNTKRNAIRGYIRANYRLIDGLSLDVKGASNLSLDEDKLFISTKDVYQGRAVSGFGMFNIAENVLWNFRSLLKFEKVFSKHSLTVRAGGELAGSSYSWNQSSYSGYPNDQVQEVDNANLSSSNKNNYKTGSLLGLLSYNFAQKYFVHVNIRADNTSRFSNSVKVKSDPIKPDEWAIEHDRKWGTSEGVSLAWRLSREDFLTGLTALSDLTLRAGYGIAGNDGGYQAGRIYPYYWAASGYSFNPDEEFTVSLFPNVGYLIANLQDNMWEKTSELSAGIDLALYSNRIRFTMNYFNRDNKDLILPSSDTTYANSGAINRSGLEFSLNTLNVLSDKFRWSTGLTVTTMKNTVTRTDGNSKIFEVGFDGISNVIKKDEPVFAYWGLETDGIFQNQGEVDAHASQPGAGPGDIRYKNQNSDNVIDANDRVVIGNPNPDLIVGFQNNLRYGNWELSIFFTGVYGQDKLNLNRMQTEGLNDWINQSAATLNRWTGPGTSDEMPRADIGNQNNVLISDRFIEDASYIRLKNVTLGYVIPGNKTGKLNLSFVKIFATAQNVLTITDYSGFDPETSSMGPLNVDYGAYPNARYFGGGLSIGF